MNLGLVSPGRWQIRGSLTSAQVDDLIADQSLTVLQTTQDLEPETWDLLNARFFASRPEVELRVYGGYNEAFDLSFVKHLDHVRRFSADCLHHATGVENIKYLSELQSLRIGVFDLESFDFLNDLQPDHLTTLTLSPTRSKKPRLRVIERFTQLRTLCLAGQQKDIEVIGKLSHLQDLILCSITVPSLDFLHGLDELWSLAIKLGGTKNLADLAALKRVKYLELWQIQGLVDLGSIAEMTGLQFLFLQSLRNVVALPDFSRLTALRRLCLENLKGLRDLAAVETAPALEALLFVSAMNLQPAHFSGLLEKGRLKRLSVEFGSDRKNNELREMKARAGIEEARSSPFEFR